MDSNQTDDQAEWATFVAEPAPSRPGDGFDLTAALEANVAKLRKRAAVLREMALIYHDDDRLDALYYAATGMDIDAGRMAALVARRNEVTQ